MNSVKTGDKFKAYLFVAFVLMNNSYRQVTNQRHTFTTLFVEVQNIAINAVTAIVAGMVVTHLFTVVCMDLTFVLI